MKLAFTTLACPGWTLPEVVAAAREYGYDGLELRLLDNQPIDASLLRGRLATLPGELDGLPVASLNSSIRLAVDGDEWSDELRALIDIAAELGVPSIRLWGGEYEGKSRKEAIAVVANRLATAAQLAAPFGVDVALETHDAWRSLAVLRGVFTEVLSRDVKVLWDVQNTHAIGGSAPQEVWDELGSRITQIHVKDARPGQGEYGELVLLGEGDVPVRESLEVLRDNGFDGWVTVNWLKFQHPDIPDPRIALPQYARTLREWIADPTPRSQASF